MTATHVEVGMITVVITKSGIIEMKTLGQSFALLSSIPDQDPAKWFSGQRFRSTAGKWMPEDAFEELDACNNAAMKGDGESYYRLHNDKG